MSCVHLFMYKISSGIEMREGFKKIINICATCLVFLTHDVGLHAIVYMHSLYAAWSRLSDICLSDICAPPATCP